MRSGSKLLALAALLGMGACDSGRHSSAGFRLPPDGDVERGKVTFVALGCHDLSPCQASTCSSLRPVCSSHSARWRNLHRDHRWISRHFSNIPVVSSADRCPPKAHAVLRRQDDSPAVDRYSRFSNRTTGCGRHPSTHIIDLQPGCGSSALLNTQ